jgi:hypothetical protein
MNETLTLHLLKWQDKWLMQQAQHVTHMKLSFKMLVENLASHFYVIYVVDVANINMLQLS